MTEQHFMIVDFYGSGHHSQYLSYAVRYWVDHKPGSRLTLCLVQDVFDNNPELLDLIESSNAGIYVHVIADYRKPVLDSTRNLFRNDKLQGAILARLVDEFRPDRLVLMHIDHVQLSLGSSKLCFPFPVSISGIYFRPTINGTSIRQRLKVLRKKFLLKRAIRNPHFDRLMSLDPRVEQLRTDWKLPDILVPIADPIDSSASSLSKSEARTAFDIPVGTTVFVTFGMIDGRKGLHVALQALMLLNPRKSICMFVVGPIDVEYRQSILDLAEETPEEITFVFKDEFVSEIAIPDILQTADAALLLYQNHTGSSNVLVRTALAGIPVIACDDGLVGYNVTHHGLGLVVDATDPNAVANAFGRFIDKPGQFFDIARAAQFADSNSASEFGRVLFDN